MGRGRWLVVTDPQTACDHETVGRLLDRVARLEADLQRADERHATKDELRLRGDATDARFKVVESEIADLKGEKTWLLRLVLAAVIMAVLGVVLVVPGR